ncbi:hypothetical protein NSA50_19675 [Clostridium sp. DSM 100503]|uniref:hypothetical protein n=1 Tax=Clostridium sp. DSM 100503 TaxID=2963282 RepID=UPI00214A36EE|nr:hypothetical protein [Clostridium sp. DSM 100503]MCR1953205.1 hypothetical protein [Clostridium sp. DSM 100503]
MNQYKIFLSAIDTKIKDRSRLRIDLYGDMKIKDVKELKDFNIKYCFKGHDDFVSIKGKMIPRKVRYIQVFKR